MVRPIIVSAGHGAKNVVNTLPKELELTVVDANDLIKCPRPEGAIIVACLGGQSGTCGAIASAAYLFSQEIPAMAVVTMPLIVEGPQRWSYAEEGLRELRRYVEYDRVLRNDDIDLSLSIVNGFTNIDEIIGAEIVAIINRLNEN